MKPYLLIGLSAIILIVGDNLWKIIDADSSYFILHSIAWVIIFLYCTLVEKGNETINFKLKEHGFTSFKLAVTVLLLGINDLIQQVFFDGTKVEVNAYIYLLVAIVYLISTAKRKNKTNPTTNINGK